jgi:hypothetical protein
VINKTPPPYGEAAFLFSAPDPAPSPAMI